VNVYAELLNRHLTSYKASRLGVDEPGTFRHKGIDLEYGHILPMDLKWLNLLEPFRGEIRRYLEAHPEISPHKFFHHLNSSQAFALNLFYPFFQEGGSENLIRALGREGSMASWCPEYVPDAQEGTNVDVAWHDAGGSWTYCEVKLSEQGFGTAKHDQRHEEKLAVTYGPVLDPYCPPELLEPATFFANYQILRNVWLAAKDEHASVLFLMPRENERLWGPLQSVIRVLTPDLSERIHVVAVEDVLTMLARDDSLPARLRCQAGLLVEKYLPVGSTN